MKKLFKILICIVSAIVLIIVGVVLIMSRTAKVDLSTITPLESSVKVYEKGIYGNYTAIAKVDASGNPTAEEIKITSFTDTHLDSNVKKGAITYQMIINNIKATEPDLVVFVGDNITGALNKQRAIQLCEIMEKFNVYWTCVLGNHEGDNLGSITRQKMVEIFASYSHCLIESDIKTLADGTNVDGNGNHVINLVNNTGIYQSLYFIDGGSEMTKSDIKKYNITVDRGSYYDYIKQSQIDWYKETVAAIETYNGNEVKSMLFVHIPLPEFKTGYAEITKDDTIYEYNTPNENGDMLVYGIRTERVCCSDYNSGLFDVILELGSTQAVISGHDHINNFRILYKGVMLCYNQPSGYSSYNMITSGKGDTLIQGCSIYTIKANGSIEYNQRVNADYYDQTDIISFYN